MILSGEMRRSGRFTAAPRQGALAVSRKQKAAEQAMELQRVEQEIEAASTKVKLLADELGARYAVFRCELGRYDDGREERGTEIMRLSRQTDDCIQSIYRLEQRRKELLRRIGK